VKRNGLPFAPRVAVIGPHRSRETGIPSSPGMFEQERRSDLFVGTVVTDGDVREHKSSTCHRAVSSDLVSPPGSSSRSSALPRMPPAATIPEQISNAR
jgi:hypothetical protein